MGTEGRGPYPRGALPEQESDPGDEFFEVGATIVDPDAARKATAALAAARGFGVNEVITKESKNISAALAAHEKNIADERRGSAHPTPVVGLPLQVDAAEIEEIEAPAPEPPRPVQPAFREADVSDRFDINVATGSSPSPLPARPRGNGLILVIIALISAVGGFAFFRYGAARLTAGKRPPAATTAAAR